jgi:ATP:corrinoid adenosyltransferase
MPSTPSTIGELFRSLGLSLTIRAAEGDDESWSCSITRPDGQTYEIDVVSFFDVDPETGEEWTVEPTPSRVLSVLAGTDVEAEDDEESDSEAAAETQAAVRAFLGDDAYDLLLVLDAEGIE